MSDHRAARPGRADRDRGVRGLRGRLAGTSQGGAGHRLAARRLGAGAGDPGGPELLLQPGRRVRRGRAESPRTSWPRRAASTAIRGCPKGALMIAPPLLPPDWAATAGKLNLTEGQPFHQAGVRHRDRAVRSRRRRGTRPRTARRPGRAPPRARVGHGHDDHLRVHHAGHDRHGRGVRGQAELAAVRRLGRERIIAVGSIFVNGECADMFGAATIPEGRGRGAQSALLTARARAARAAGCRWLVAETGAEGPGDHNTSLQNMLRAGFEPLYDRVTWLWQRVARVPELPWPESPNRKAESNERRTTSRRPGGGPASAGPALASGRPASWPRYFSTWSGHVQACVQDWLSCSRGVFSVVDHERSRT